MTTCRTFAEAVICRIGSLESKTEEERLELLVICRIGSLENLDTVRYEYTFVICRIGSLENSRWLFIL